MTEDETRALIISLLHSAEPFLHVRFGDGDVMFTSGIGSKITGDGEEFSRRLQIQLLDAWIMFGFIDMRVLVGDVESYDVSDGCEAEWRILKTVAEWLRPTPMEFVHIEALRCSRPGSREVYEKIRDYPGRKVYVGPTYLEEYANKLGCLFVSVPLHKAHEYTREGVKLVVDLHPDLVLFSAGRGGKIMQAALAVHNRDIAQIDIGSGLDLLASAGVRRGTDLGIDRMKVVRHYQEVGLA